LECSSSPGEKIQHFFVRELFCLGCWEIIAMMDWYRIARPLLFTLPPEWAHALTLTGLRAAHRLLLLSSCEFNQPIDLMGLTFPNRFGIAAGLDKNASFIDPLGALGFGFIEVGTVTPRPQSGSLRPRLFRLPTDRALINRMGFPNDGADAVFKRLQVRRYRGICGVNIGKNAATPIIQAEEDYVAALRTVHAVADYIAVNISSPNTAELRSLQGASRLHSLLVRLVTVRDALGRESNRQVPLLIKFTADVGDDELIASAHAAVHSGVDGIIAVNTTTNRPLVSDRRSYEAGGLSGAPLLGRAIEAVRCIRSEVGSKFPIIGVGGIQSAADARAMREAGADLVQIYTGLIYRGPALVREILASNSIV